MQNLWVFSFEYAGIIKVGGLGEVPANQTKWLADQYNITLFIPTHGVLANSKIKRRLQVKKLDFEFKTQLNALKMNMGDTKEEVHIAYYEGKINGIDVILLGGMNEFTSRYLDDPIVYSPDSLSGKFVLYSLGIKGYIRYILKENLSNVPTIIHCHDHHGVPALMACRQTLLSNSKDVATVITIHLLSWPRKDLDFLRACGVEEIPFDIYIGEEYKVFTLSDFYRFVKGSETLEPTLEKIGVFFADLVTSVSEDYAVSNVVGNIGGGWIYHKTDFTWNGCDWDFSLMQKSVEKDFGLQLKELDENSPLSRRTLRKFLLTQGFSTITENPKIPSQKVEQFLHDHLTFFPYVTDKEGIPRGRLADFSEDGPLIITTGRVSKQKGIDVLIDAIPLVLKSHPETKFVFSVLPTEFSISDIEVFLNRVKIFPNNVRLVFGKVFSLFYLMHLAADIYCAPSRWEPFGITALEAMVSKDIVVASQTGGLQEIILDIREKKEKGTGLLVPAEDPEALATAISDLVSIIKIDEVHNPKSSINAKKLSKLKKQIQSPKIQELVDKNLNLASLIRENAAERVEKEFRWKIVTQKLPVLYSQALRNRGKIR